MLQALEVPAVRLSSVDDLLSDEHLEAVGFFEEIDHPSEGPLRLPRSPILMSETAPGISKPAAPLGADTEQVMTELGYPPDRVRRLVESTHRRGGPASS